MENQQKSLGAQLKTQINLEKGQKSQLKNFWINLSENFKEKLHTTEFQQTSL